MNSNRVFVYIPFPELRFGNSSSPRSVEETLIRSFAIHLVAATTNGHLLSLQNYHHKRSIASFLYIVAFLLLPLLPLAQLLRNLLIALPLKLSQRCKGITFYTSAGCGMHTAKSSTGDSCPLTEIKCEEIRFRRKSYSLVWIGRVLVLAALAVQYIGTILLWFRRALLANTVRVWQIDTRNLEVVVGGLIALLMSLVIIAINAEWTIETEHARDEELQPVNNSGGEPTIRRAVSTVTASATGENLQTQHHSTTYSQRFRYCIPGLRCSHRIKSWCEKTKTWYLRFRRLNLQVSNASFHVYPASLQWNIELAYMMHVLGSIFLIPFDGYNPELLRNPSSHFSPRMIYYNFRDSFFHAGFLSYKLRLYYIMSSLYLLPCILIIVHLLLWLVAHMRITRFLPGPIKSVLIELDFWLRSGRNVISIPISLLMLLPVYMQILFLKYDFEAIGRASYMSKLGWSDDGVFWQDPLADKLFII
jgi:hypothetical protein